MAVGAGPVASRASLVMLSVPGVQRHIAASRTTGDLTSGSGQIAALASAGASALARGGARLIFGDDGTGSKNGPNRVVALVADDPDGSRGAELARMAADDVRAVWSGWLSRVFPGSGSRTPGFPDVQWVCVPPSDGSYKRQFLRAQESMAARRRVRTFSALAPEATGRQVCSVTARWLAEPDPPPRARPHEKAEMLSALMWVKRIAPHADERPRTPSMASIATAPFRRRVLAHLNDDDVAAALGALASAAEGLGLAEAPIHGLTVPDTSLQSLRPAVRWLIDRGGSWVDPGRWTPRVVLDESRTPMDEAAARTVATTGRAAAQRLARSVGATPGGYLAVIVLDLDDMGLFLSGRSPSRSGGWCPVTVDSHREIAGTLAEVAARQMRDLESGPLSGTAHAVPVYLGGDDLLLLAPAASALQVAQVVHDAVPDSLPTSSAAVLFVSRQAGLQPAVRDAQALLADAKRAPGKDRLAVGYQRRSGSTRRTILRWSDAASVLAAFSGAAADMTGLSPRLVTDLQRETQALAELEVGGFRRLVDAELRRLIDRHLPEPARGTEAAAGLAAALATVGLAETVDGFDPVPAARVAMFLAGEAR